MKVGRKRRMHDQTPRQIMPWRVMVGHDCLCPTRHNQGDFLKVTDPAIDGDEQITTLEVFGYTVRMHTVTIG